MFPVHSPVMYKQKLITEYQLLLNAIKTAIFT